MNKAERIKMLENALEKVNAMNEKIDRCINKVNSMNNSIEELKGSLEVIANFSGDATEHINLKRDMQIVKETVEYLDHVSDNVDLTVCDYVKNSCLGIDDIKFIQERLNEHEGVKAELVDLYGNSSVVYTILKVTKY